MAKCFTDSKGYKRFSDSGKSVHGWAASKKVGGSLYSNQRVHHKNRIKSDNRPGNLWVFNSQKTHTATHNRDKKKTGFW